MSTEPSVPEHLDALSRAELMSALFANMIVQQTNMAMVFLGKVPHPETNQPVRELDTAQMFIDQLEMLAFKTRGNLDKDEDHLLQQSLMTLRMAFVEAVDKPPTQAASQSSPAQTQTPEPGSPAADTSQSSGASQPIVSGDSGAEESRKRFTKKY